MSVATEDKLMTLMLVYLTRGSIEGTEDLGHRRHLISTHSSCSVNDRTELPLQRRAGRYSAIVYGRTTAQGTAVFTSLNTAALPCSGPTLRFKLLAPELFFFKFSTPCI